MKNRSGIPVLVAILLQLVVPAELSFAVAPDPKVAEELRVRDGLPNFFSKLTAGAQVCIAYLGGSITAAEGWRPKTLAWFRQQYPQAKVIEINAAISGTGSDYGACRIAGDVLSKEPDLNFMEHRVNGGGGYEAKSVEGIVRQIWRNNPRIDICLVNTISQGMLSALQAGNQPWFGDIILIKRPQTESRKRYARFFYLPEQTPGEHTAVLRVTQLPEGLSYYLGQILIIGSQRAEG